jgi:hypothetical protein
MCTSVHKIHFSRISRPNASTNDSPASLLFSGSYPSRAARPFFILKHSLTIDSDRGNMAEQIWASQCRWGNVSTAPQDHILAGTQKASHGIHEPSATGWWDDLLMIAIGRTSIALCSRCRPLTARLSDSDHAGRHGSRPGSETDVWQFSPLFALRPGRQIAKYRSLVSGFGLVVPTRRHVRGRKSLYLRFLQLRAARLDCATMVKLSSISHLLAGKPASTKPCQHATFPFC